MGVGRRWEWGGDGSGEEMGVGRRWVRQMSEGGDE